MLIFKNSVNERHVKLGPKQAIVVVLSAFNMMAWADGERTHLISSTSLKKFYRHLKVYNLNNECFNSFIVTVCCA